MSLSGTVKPSKTVDPAPPRPAEVGERGIQFRIALLAGGAALAGALIGAATSVYISSSSQATQQSETRRAERMTSYSQLYSAVTAYLADIGSVAPQLVVEYAARDRDETRIEELDQRLDALGMDIFRAQSGVVLVGGQDVAEAGFRLGSEAEKVRRALTAEGLTKEEIQPALDSMAEELDAFSEVARADLDD